MFRISEVLQLPNEIKRLKDIGFDGLKSIVNTQ